MKLLKDSYLYRVIIKKKIMWWYILAVAIVMYSAGRLDEQSYGRAAAWFWMPVVAGFILLLSMTFENPNHFVVGKNRPEYFIQEDVMLPDSTYGRIEGIYYKVEGKVYKQDLLKQ